MRFREFLKEDTGITSLAVPNGRTGPEVADIQKVLGKLGYDLGAHGVDGIRGPDTSAAVKKFQSDVGLTIDGDPGPNTVDMLNKIVKDKADLFKGLTKSTSADVKSTGAESIKMGALAQDSVTQGKVGKVLDMIARVESGGSYDVMMGGKHVPEILRMTIAELLDYQRSRKSGGETSAAGRYQYMPSTLLGYAKKMGVDINEQKFDPKFQDQLAIYTMRYQCRLDDWLAGKIDDTAFLNLLAPVWAGLPKSTGLSAYQGVGSNKAGTSSDVALNTLQDIRTA